MQPSRPSACQRAKRRAEEFDEVGVMDAMQSGFRIFTRRRLLESAGLQGRQNVTDAGGRFKRRHELAAVQLLAASWRACRGE
jgi:hypothetical protein